ALHTRAYEVHGVRRAGSGPECAPGEWHCADLLDPVASQRLIRQIHPDVLVHAAWETTHGEFWSSPMNHAWVSASIELARAFVGAGGRHLVGVGFCADYSWRELRDGVAIQEHPPRVPASLYGVSKNLVFEKLSGLFEQAGVSFAWGRLFQPYGPGDARPTLLS